MPSEPDRAELDSATASFDPVVDAQRLQHISNRYITTAHLSDGSDPSFDQFSLTVADVEGCIIDLCDVSLLPAILGGSPARLRRCTALYMNRVKNTIIVVGSSILGSVLLQQLEDCVVVVGAHQVSRAGVSRHDRSFDVPVTRSGNQFRLHDSYRCSVLLATQSIATIEKSTDIKFGGYPEELRLPEGHEVRMTANKRLIGYR